MAKTTVADEVEERIEYFEDWLVRLSNDREREKVVNERTAREFIRNSFMKDSSLRHLVEGMDTAGGYDAFLKGSYIQTLIELNTRLIPGLDKGVGRLRRRRQGLEKVLPEKRKTVARKKVITNTMTNKVLKIYGIQKTVNKNGTIVYRDLKGRFVKNDALLGVADRVIASSAQKRKEFDAIYKRELDKQKKNRPRKNLTKK